MEEIKREDLKDNEIYYVDTINFGNYIFINKNKLFDCTGINNEKLKHNLTFGNSQQIYFKFREATPEEKHWLEVCIKEDKFISYENAMKTFEKEFVLPEKWCIERNQDNYEIINKWFKDNDHGSPYLNFSKIAPANYKGGYHSLSSKLGNYTEITFEQFEKYVLNKKPEVLEQPKDKITGVDIDTDENKIVEVECAEGGIYKIGDKITVFTKDSPNKGKVFTIKGFRWNNAKTNLCAITELHTPNGIGLDKIELYVEPKKELSLLEQTKLRYPVGTKFKNAFRYSMCSNKVFEIKDQRFFNVHEKGITDGNNNWLNLEGQWAEIIEDFVLPEKWCVKVNDELRVKFGYYKALGYHHSVQINDTNKWSDKIKKGFTEITFEQFLKYVVNE